LTFGTGMDLVEVLLGLEKIHSRGVTYFSSKCEGADRHLACKYN
jgi:hypothetical protein